MTTATSLEPLVVRTVELNTSDPRATAALVDLVPPGRPLAWVHDGEGLIGWGEATRLVVSGPDRFASAVEWWRALHLDAVVSDQVQLPGTGPVAFGSFTFADGPTSSVLVVPQVVLGRRDGRSWLTVIGSGEPELDRPVPAASGPQNVEFTDGALDADEWRRAVATAVERIRAGQLSKVVLARDLIARADAPVDVRHLVRRLNQRFPACYTFSVDGLVGATPELLVRREGDHVVSRVLAGTAWAADAAARLLASDKDREEHEYAVRSAFDAIAPYCTELRVPQQPSVMELANVSHLASEVTGTLRTRASLNGTPTDALSLAGLLHPTAAVCGTPTGRAGRAIAQLEGMDRGRYAGPVGWMDARGDGEWGIALRCAEVDGARLRLFAGCGIVAGSDPESEFAEAQAKFVAVREVLEG
ncbi:isochorismate synthase [Sporichthya polymorpha]|uniref:isochorismate synthase n=1 Tax=Sporichthya polymorpha TaxID=35751 RepID=UPI00048C2505|nr:isochorismate synthase [Sporichthya polymorpha]